ncbi:MAG: alpha-L-fucosidase [Edaphobacter sp.]|uniref:alpha-L-fucosidase n=1 Tax=Edaphobacter sp. TaxID=1934404 RepID=UPI00239E9BF3|nr:alpha-L-fucosidase [Edaphobacter sp.]MDE1177997.1 alpha-L-fucosidase [Edaphobacter sp.]
MLSLSAHTALFASLPRMGFAAPVADNGRAVALPTADQVRWQNLEVGMFVHFSNETYLNGRPSSFSVPPSEVNPVNLDTDAWAKTAVAAGARYIVFVAKHQYGFCCWQTKTTDFGLSGSPWKGGKGDIMRELESSCKKFGLGLGVYLSPRDDHFGAATGGICKTPEEQAKYDAIYREQLTELLSGYGELVEVWFDGATATPVGDLLKTYQPHVAVFQGPNATIRWVGNEDGFAPYPCWNGIERSYAEHGTGTALDGTPDGDAWLPNEVDVSIRRPDWFWTATNAKKVLTEDQLLSIYYRSVGRGAQLLLNLPPNTTGLFDEKDAEAAARFGAEVKRRFGKSLAETSGHGSVVTLKLKSPARIDTVVLQEDTTLGERVRAYRLEGRANSAWKPLGEGTAIGQKRIQPVTPVTVDAVRVVVTRSAGLAALRRLAVFDTGVAPPADWNAPSSIWAPDLVGSWKNGHFELDLRGHTKEAAQYRLRLMPSEGAVTAIKDVVLMLGGASQPKMLKRVPGKPNELIVDVTGMGDSGTISGTVEGAATGQILMGKL